MFWHRWSFTPTLWAGISATAMLQAEFHSSTELYLKQSMSCLSYASWLRSKFRWFPDINYACCLLYELRDQALCTNKVNRCAYSTCLTVKSNLLEVKFFLLNLFSFYRFFITFFTVIGLNCECFKINRSNLQWLTVKSVKMSDLHQCQSLFEARA